MKLLSVLTEGVKDFSEFNQLVTNIFTWFSKTNSRFPNRYAQALAGGSIDLNKSIIFNHSELRLDMLGLNMGDFSHLGEFIANSNLKISFVNIPASVGASYHSVSATIRMNYKKPNFGRQLNEKMSQMDVLNMSTNEKQNFMYDILSDVYRGDLLHELQHAYDDFRSGGKYASDKMSNKYYEKYADSFEVDDERREMYYNLPHEYWADLNRFLLLVNKEMGFENVMEKFKTDFKGYRFLKDESKRKLFKALYKYWSNL